MLLRKKVLKVQEQAVPVCHKMSRWGRRLAWPNGGLLLSVQEKKRVYAWWKKGQPTRGEYKEAAGI